jgi:hypothetical protein
MRASTADTVLVYLSESEIPFHVNLVFENTYSDTILISGVYKNFRFSTESIAGIMVNTHRNGRTFFANLGEGGDVPDFRFSDERFLMIPPHSRLEFPMSVRRYFSSSRANVEIGISFHINYFYGVINRTRIPEFISTQTNYVEVKKTNEDEKE